MIELHKLLTVTKGGNVAQQLFRNIKVLMLCHLWKIFQHSESKTLDSDTDPAAPGSAAGAAGAAACNIFAIWIATMQHDENLEVPLGGVAVVCHLHSMR